LVIHGVTKPRNTPFHKVSWGIVGFRRETSRIWKGFLQAEEVGNGDTGFHSNKGDPAMMPPFDLRLLDHPPAKYVRSNRYVLPSQNGKIRKFLTALLLRIQGVVADRQIQSNTP
jgi:hypothetical protein